MRRIHSLSLVLLAAPSCAPADGPMLHRMGSYAGSLTWSMDGSSGAAQLEACDLSFHRGNGNLQAKFEETGRVVTLIRGADQRVGAFENARRRDPTPAEAARFRVVRDLVDPGKIEAEEPGAVSYRVRCGGRWYRVTIESQTETRVHGQPR